MSRWLAAFLFVVTVASAAGPGPVEFRFPAGRSADPFGREIAAEVQTPSGKIVVLPAYYAGEGQFAVRARASETGTYTLGRVTEVVDGRTVDVAVGPRRRQRVFETESLPQVGRAPGRPPRLAFADGRTYVPVGANVAWGDGTRVKYHLGALDAFGRAGLNWMRVWMAHWTALNLDWLPADLGPSPKAGALDLRVAADWDRIVARAEERGVYLQVVLQHHGQYSTSNDSNWKDNPWNAANPGGFLQRPAEFFSSDEARRLTRRKYRYIVARWGYSPAVLSWELFNEVHWTDAFRKEHDEALVAHWHAEMADFLRSADPYHHLVTTSTENLHSAIYDRLDYFQPHNYPPDVIVGPRALQVPAEELDRPVFYGEMGDDQARVSKAQKESAITIVPSVWASLMGQGRYPGQPWLGWDLLKTKRLGELAALARFVRTSGISARDGLVAFSPGVSCAAHVPMTVHPGESWQRETAPELVLPLDGRMPVDLARIPATYVGGAASLAEGFPGRVTWHIDVPATTTIRARIDGIDGKAAEATFSALLDNKEVARQSWSPGPGAPSAEHPAEVTFSIPTGEHTLVVQNPGAPGWFGLGSVEFGNDIPALAAIGRRSSNFVAVWLWHRDGVFTLGATPAVTAKLELDDVPAGTWKVVWWNTLLGIAEPSRTLRHPGGRLELPTPAISRHAAVVLTRL